jgi:hypothetical protein
LQFILLEHKTQDFIKTTAGNCICKLMQWDFLAIKSWNPISLHLVLLDFLHNDKDSSQYNNAHTTSQSP